MKYRNWGTTFLIIFSAFLSISCAPTPTREGTAEYLEDAVITAKVKEAVLAEPSLKSTEIIVETFNGTVQLSGFVKSQEDKKHAGEVTRQVKGVYSVRNEIKTK